MRAADIMGGRLFFVTPDEPVSRAATLLRDGDVGALPVVDSPSSMKLVGMITDRDIAVRHVADGHAPDCPVGAHMTTGHVVTVREDDHVHDVLGRMRSHQVRRIPVVDEEHRLVGIVAQADVAVHLGPSEPREVEKMLEAVSAPMAGAL